VRPLAGGFYAWRASGYPMIDLQRAASGGAGGWPDPVRGRRRSRHPDVPGLDAPEAGALVIRSVREYLSEDW